MIDQKDQFPEENQETMSEMTNENIEDQIPEATTEEVQKNKATELEDESILSPMNQKDATELTADVPEVEQPLAEQVNETVMEGDPEPDITVVEEPEIALEVTTPQPEAEGVDLHEEKAAVEATMVPEVETTVEGADESLGAEIPAAFSEATHLDETVKDIVAEEEEEEELDTEEIHDKYDEYPREKLVELLDIEVEAGDIQDIKTKVALIKVAFLKLTREEERKRYEEHFQAGGKKEDFTPYEDELTVRFNTVFEKYKEKKSKYNEEQEVLKLRNLDAKKQILEELKSLINADESLKKTYDRFKELQNQWKEIGVVPSGEVNNMWQSYHFLVEKFFDKVKISKELRDLDLKKNLEKKIELCEKAEELLLESSIIKSFKLLQKYHEEWKEIGPVPSDKRDEVWERFKNTTDKINERRREHYNRLSEDREKNLVTKTALCEKAEQMLSEEILTIKDWQEKTKEINEMFNIWKTIGPAPKKDNDEIWERFKTYLNTFFSNKKEFFSDLKEEQMQNYNLKLNLCSQAEALKESTDWKKTTNDLINLQKEWKNIGPVPRKYADKVWLRFRAACDEFFNRKSEFFGNLESSEKENLQKKLELIEQVEKYQFGADKVENLHILKDFQRKWMEIGHVPIKEKDKVHKSFREAINKHLDQLNISNFEMQSADFSNKVDTMLDSPNGNRMVRKEMNFLAIKISKMREDINLWENNIGFLAHSKTADLLKMEFEKKINKAKEELALMEAKYKYLNQSLDR